MVEMQLLLRCETLAMELWLCCQAELVWAQLGRRQTWWPAIVIAGEDCGHTEPKHDHRWVFWFGDHKVSQVSVGSVLCFVICIHVQFLLTYVNVISSY